MGTLFNMMLTSSLGPPVSATTGNNGRTDAQLNVSMQYLVVWLKDNNFKIIV